VWRVWDALTFGPHRRRRRLAAQLLQRDSPLYWTPARPREWTPGRHADRRLSPRRTRAPQFLAAALVFGALVVAVPHLQERGASAPSTAGWPGSGKRVLPAVTGPAGTGGFAFAVEHGDGSPVTYDPCRPLHYAIDLRGAPAGARRLVHRAVVRVQAATGLQFVYDGTTTERPIDHRGLVHPTDDDWPPVTIAWATEDEEPRLAGRIVGIGGSTRVGSDADLRYVTGRIVLERATFHELLRTPQGAEKATAIVLHELGHVVGLSHIPDPAQLMYAETAPGVTDFAPGDLRGLALLGAGRCRPRG